MLKKMNFRSKKGISLAVALTICLFMVLVTGSITTVAVLQHKETGSAMNTRQAYISAKSGLDTMQDALEGKIVTSLPAGIGEANAEYCILYYHGSTGQLHSVPVNMPANGDIASVVSQKIKDLLRDGHEIVGGEGTYFKITNQDGKKYNVTALNTTGKYNDDLTLNRGDLSFDIIIVKTYTVTIDPTPAPTDPPTPPTGPNSGGLHNRFMLVGQQTCLNELAGPNGNQSTGRTLNRDFVEKEGGSQSIVYDGVCYAPYNENGGSYAFTYFPIVYDKFVWLTSSNNRVSIKVYDEGIYLVGSASGKIVNKYIDPNRNSITTFGEVSFLNENPQYGETFECNFLCIKENVVLRRHESGAGADLKVKYCGTEGLDYVVVYIPGPDPVTFYSVTEGGQNTDAGEIIGKFDIPAGYYKLPNDSVLNNLASWKDSSGNWRTLSDTEDDRWIESNLYSTIVGYATSGQIHTGSKETAYGDTSNPNVNVQIVDENGQYITGNSDQSGYSSSSAWTPTYSTRNNYSVFFSPNYPITVPGYYHWYCGNTFNFQWCRNSSTSLNVATGAHVKMSASTVVLTIGPDVKTETGNTVEVSKDIKGAPNSSWEIRGANGTGSTNLYVMTDFNVSYTEVTESGSHSGSYPVKAGYYINVPAEGVNLFSKAGENYFRYTSDVRSMADNDQYVKPPMDIPENPTETQTEAPSATAPTTDNTTTTDTALNSVSTNSAVMPASVSANTLRTLSIFNRTRNTMALSPMTPFFARDIDDGVANGIAIIAPGDVTGRSEVVADYEIEHLYFKDNDLADNLHTIPVNTTLKIQRKISSNETTDYIVFVGDSGRSFQIPYDSNDGDSFDLFEGDVIDAREDASGANYNCEVSDEVPRVIKKYY